MKNRSTIIAGLLAALLSFCFIDPFHIVSGKFDSNPYTEIQNELNQPTTTGVLVLASYNDLYNFPVYRYLRDILGTRLAYHGEISVENGYDEVIVQASLGEESFLKYLKSRNISHLIIPLSTVETGEVFHRWSTHGTVKLNLGSKSFSKLRQTTGNYPLALYAVNNSETGNVENPPPKYSLDWRGVRPNFFQLLRVINEWYEVKYVRKYEERIDSAWVFDGEQAEVTFHSPDTPKQKFSIELQFVAAYGENAPPQVLRVNTDETAKSLVLEPNEVSTATFIVHDGQKITIKNVFECRTGLSFDPESQDIRKFCYGLRDVIVRIVE